MMLFLVIAACSSKEDDSGGVTNDTNTTDTQTTPPCTVLTSGDWSATGAVFSMTMSVTLTMDEAACSFAFSDWSMTHDTPDGGTIDGDEVTLTGDGWTSCVGTASDTETVTGDCAGDSFEFTYKD